MKKLLLFVLCANVYATDYPLTPDELKLLENADKLSPVESWNPVRVYPDITNDVAGYKEPVAKHYFLPKCVGDTDLLGGCAVKQVNKGK